MLIKQRTQSKLIVTPLHLKLVRISFLQWVRSSSFKNYLIKKQAQAVIPVNIGTGGTSVRTSKYPSWKDKLSQRCIQSLGVDAHSPVCRACRDDVSRLVKNPAFIPRWEKEKEKENCIIQTCNGKDLHYSHTISSDELIAFGFDIHNVIPTPFPLCKYHYFLDPKPQTSKNLYQLVMIITFFFFVYFLF